MLFAMSLELSAMSLVSAFSAVAEAFFKDWRYKIVGWRVVIRNDNGIFLVNKFFHEIFGEDRRSRVSAEFAFEKLVEGFDIESIVACKDDESADTDFIEIRVYRNQINILLPEHLLQSSHV